MNYSIHTKLKVNQTYCVKYVENEIHDVKEMLTTYKVQNNGCEIALLIISCAYVYCFIYNIVISYCCVKQLYICTDS